MLRFCVIFDNMGAPDTREFAQHEMAIAFARRYGYGTIDRNGECKNFRPGDVMDRLTKQQIVVL